MIFMKKFRNFTLIAAVVVFGYGLLAKYIPGITISEFAWGFCIGFSSVMLAVAIGLAVAPLFCKKKNCCDAPNPQQVKK